jgi:hypothetical protein
VNLTPAPSAGDRHELAMNRGLHMAVMAGLVWHFQGSRLHCSLIHINGNGGRDP